MINDFLVLIIIALLISNIFYFRKEYKRKRRKKYSYGNKEHYNVTNATSKANYQTFKAIERRLDTEISRIIDRIDKLEVDTAYIKNFTIKSDTSKSDSEIIPDPKKVKEPLMFFSKSLKDSKVRKSKLFSEKEIDKELRSHLGDILFLTPSEYKEEYQKAYRRLYYKTKTKNK